MKNSTLKKNLESSIQLKQNLLDDKAIMSIVEQVSEIMITCFKNNGKVLFCGNGGSAADAQHLSTELSGRYYFDRPPLFSEALSVNSSFITAIANDYSFEKTFARMTKAMGQSGDVLIGLSTSGNSKNVVAALATAQEIGMTTIGMTGQGGGKLKAVSDFHIEVPSTDTPRIQECHMLIGHTLCEIVEHRIFSKE